MSMTKLAARTVIESSHIERTVSNPFSPSPIFITDRIFKTSLNPSKFDHSKPKKLNFKIPKATYTVDSLTQAIVT
jgi:hypothetical protein